MNLKIEKLILEIENILFQKFSLYAFYPAVIFRANKYVAGEFIICSTINKPGEIIKYVRLSNLITEERNGVRIGTPSNTDTLVVYSNSLLKGLEVYRDIIKKYDIDISTVYNRE